MGSDRKLKPFCTPAILPMTHCPYGRTVSAEAQRGLCLVRHARLLTTRSRVFIAPTQNSRLDPDAALMPLTPQGHRAAGVERRGAPSSHDS